MSETKTPLLAANQLTISAGDKTLIKGLTLSLDAGDCWAILGRNGCGKTSLLNTFCGLQASTGELSLLDKPLGHYSAKSRAQIIGLMQQEDITPFQDSALQTVLAGRHPHLGFLEMESSEDFEIAMAALESVGLKGYERRLLHTLSGGELRRVYLASLFAQQPQIYLLDEPTNHIDLHHQLSIMNILQFKLETSEQPSAMMMVLHDLNIAYRFCNKVLLIGHDGSLTQGSRDEVMTSEQLSSAFAHPIERIEQGDRVIFTSF